MRPLLSCSFVLLSAIAFGGPYSDLESRLSKTRSDSEVIRIVSGDPRVAKDIDIQDSLNHSNLRRGQLAEKLRKQIDLRALAEAEATLGGDVKQEVQQIKSTPFYSDRGVDKQRNWLADALERLKNIRWDLQDPDLKSPGLGISFLGPAVVYLMWGLLAAGVLTLLYMAIRQIRWRRSLRRRANALLEDDEPDRTLDEWLKLADQYAAAGKFREAVRALYLACLIKFDENDVARFVRNETNWEHLARIESSPHLPSGFDFRTPTRRFDRIWYGYQTDGMPDVIAFRSWYTELCDALTPVAA